MVDLDEYSDNELLTYLNPSLANRLMTRRKSKAISQRSPKRSTQMKSPVKDAVKKKSTFAGPIKSKAVTKNTAVGPSKSWSKKSTTSKLAASIPEVPIDNVSFHYAFSANRWKYVLQKRLAIERELAPNALENKQVLELIQEAGLLKTVCKLPKCYDKLVKEFVVNLSEECGNSRSVDFRKVFVRGKCISFSPSVINNFLERTDEAQTELEVTDNKVCQVITAKKVNSWPLKEKLTASKQSIKYAMLYKIGASNWVPTNHKSTISTVLGRFIYAVGTKAKFDYGTYIFDQTMKLAGSFSIKGPITFPSLLCDVVITSADTSKSGASTSKAEVIAMLKETCKELESRKTSLEKMIRTLKMDENEEFADTKEVEEESASLDDGSEKESSSDTSSGSESGQ
ncbi:uncharacterized protein LOC131627061 [Vicia villosa]|uniref:uncharacterized protein LOC131627061 n=1 Tax=Vicia villosa TaxID=3911 RepID=UPI00273B2D02|nr:uncharacterized protein LOC131627061 [Vicia villosa]